MISFMPKRYLFCTTNWLNDHEKKTRFMKEDEDEEEEKLNKKARGVDFFRSSLSEFLA